MELGELVSLHSSKCGTVCPVMDWHSIGGVPCVLGYAPGSNKGLYKKDGFGGIKFVKDPCDVPA